MLRKNPLQINIFANKIIANNPLQNHSFLSVSLDDFKLKVSSHSHTSFEE